MIANAFFRAGYIESWGRGIQKIRESCEENGNDMAEYDVSASEIMVMFKSLVSSTDQDTDQANQDTDQAQGIPHKILTVIREDNSITQREIAEKTGENLSTIKYHMDKMKKSGKIGREGSSQKGTWIIF